MDRAYIDYEFFEQLTEQGVFYVTKMKKNLRYEQQDGVYLVDQMGKVVRYDALIELKKDNIIHQSRLIKYWDEKKEQVLLTNNFDLHADKWWRFTSEDGK